jgi:hypothetical protein
MKKPDIYISFDLNAHENEKEQFIEEAGQSPLPINIRGWSHPLVMDFRMDREIIQSCNVLIALVGENTFQSSNVPAEIRIAEQAQVPVIGLFLHGTGGTIKLPAGLPGNRTVTWADGWEMIAWKIAMCLNEQKNMQEEWGNLEEILLPAEPTEPARPRSPLEESNLKKLGNYLIYQLKHDQSCFVSDEDVRAAARQLGKLRSRAAVRPLVKCILVSNMYDAGAAFRDALVEIGQPALAILTRARLTGGLDGLKIHPGGPQGGFVRQAIDLIKSGPEINLKD